MNLDQSLTNSPYINAVELRWLIVSRLAVECQGKMAVQAYLSRTNNEIQESKSYSMKNG